MLSKRQISKALENNLAELGSISGAIAGSTYHPTLISIPVGKVGGYIGAKIGSKLCKLDLLSEDIVSTITDPIREIKKYFGKDILQEENTELGYYIAGIKGSGCMDLNPCVLEVIITGQNLKINAYAKEGLFKQDTCKIALESIKKRLRE